MACLPVAACRRPNIELARGRKALGALADALSLPGALPALVYAQTRKVFERAVSNYSQYGPQP